MMVGVVHDREADPGDREAEADDATSPCSGPVAKKTSTTYEAIAHIRTSAALAHRWM